MSGDWRDTLGGLIDSLPAGDDATPAKNVGAKPRKLPSLVLTYERKGRGGKEVTIISGFADEETDDEIAALASELKRALGCGGSARGGEILLQGDRRGDLRRLLPQHGRKVK